MQSLTKDHLISLVKSIILDRDRVSLECGRLKAERLARGEAKGGLQQERDAAVSSKATFHDQASERMVQVEQLLGLGQKMTALQRQLMATEAENARLSKRICQREHYWTGGREGEET